MNTDGAGEFFYKAYVAFGEQRHEPAARAGRRAQYAGRGDLPLQRLHIDAFVPDAA